MAKSFQTSVLTANNLIEGHSVFLGAEGWTRKIDAALIAVTQEQGDELLALGDRFVDDNEIVGPYLVAVSLDSGTPVPVLRREQIRASGTPTIPVGTEQDIRKAA